MLEGLILILDPENCGLGSRGGETVERKGTDSPYFIYRQQKRTGRKVKRLKPGPFGLTGKGWKSGTSGPPLLGRSGQRGPTRVPVL